MLTDFDARMRALQALPPDELDRRVDAFMSQPVQLRGRVKAGAPELIPDDLASRLRVALDVVDIEAVLKGVFETPCDADHWWTTPHPELDGVAPRDAAATPVGAVRVRDLLVSLRYGMGA